jgi:hypothetical protein
MSKLKFRVRFDYEGKEKSGRLFGGKSSLDVAEEFRQQKVNSMRNIPTQGILIEEIDMSQEVYTIFDEVDNKSISYAPVFITFSADSLTAVVKYAMKEEFRTVEFLSDQEITLSNLELERLLMKVNEELLTYKQLLDRKRDYWK